MNLDFSLGTHTQRERETGGNSVNKKREFEDFVGLWEREGDEIGNGRRKKDEGNGSD